VIEDLNLVERSTAEKILELLRRKPAPPMPRPARGGARGRMPVIVRCTSATAASVGGIGAQCYPAVMLAAHATETTQPEQTEVWLTVLGAGAGGTPGIPVVDELYHGIFAGDFEAAAGRRPRVFAVEPAAGGALERDTDHASSSPTPNSVWFDSGVAVELEESGVYLLTGMVSCQASLGFGSVGDRGIIGGRLYDTTGGNDVDGSYMRIWDESIYAGTGTNTKVVTTGYSVIYTVPVTGSSPHTVRLEVYRTPPTPGGSYVTVSLRDETSGATGGDSTTNLNAVRLD
jgi:hypothetical protein